MNKFDLQKAKLGHDFTFDGKECRFGSISPDEDLFMFWVYEPKKNWWCSRIFSLEEVRSDNRLSMTFYNPPYIEGKTDLQNG